MSPAGQGGQPSLQDSEWQWGCHIEGRSYSCWRRTGSAAAPTGTPQPRATVHRHLPGRRVHDVEEAADGGVRRGGSVVEGEVMVADASGCDLEGGKGHSRAG